MTIYNKMIYIIVPKHLVNQTKETLNDYIIILNIKNIYIFSEDDIKKMFLENNIDKARTVFLIDEFDSLINPLKSNFNFIKKHDINVNNISIAIKNIIPAAAKISPTIGIKNNKIIAAAIAIKIRITISRMEPITLFIAKYTPKSV